jgi:hypothetical protein
LRTENGGSDRDLLIDNQRVCAPNKLILLT